MRKFLIRWWWTREYQERALGRLLNDFWRDVPLPQAYAEIDGHLGGWMPPRS